MLTFFFVFKTEKNGLIYLLIKSDDITQFAEPHKNTLKSEKLKPFIYRRSNDNPNVPIIEQKKHPILKVRSVSYEQKLHLSERNYSANEIR